MTAHVTARVFAACSLLAMLACSRRHHDDSPPAHCPTADQMLGGKQTSFTVQRAYQITSERCARDGWSAAVIDCLNQPGHDEDKCLDQLTAAQQKSLEDGLAVLTGEGKSAGHHAFLDSLEHLHATPGPVHDAAECIEYRATMESVSARAVGCAAISDGEMFGPEDVYERSIRELIALPADRAADVRAACARGTRQLRAGRSCMSLLSDSDSSCMPLPACDAGSASSAPK